MIISITLDSLNSVKLIGRQFFINFISVKFCLADVVEIRIVKHIWLPVHVDWGIML